MAKGAYMPEVSTSFEMSERRVEIVVEPYKKIVVHEVIEYKLADWFTQIVNSASAAGGTTIPMIQWCNGIVFGVQPFNPNSEEVIREQLNGTIHFANVTFAVKKDFEREVRIPEGTVKLIDSSTNPNFVKLADLLKKTAKYSA
jgi:hypothetical protein